jgi:predicted glycogen debranching enzyme
VLRLTAGELRATGELYRDFRLARETERGLRDLDDHVQAATFDAEIAPGQTLMILASGEEDTGFQGDPLQRRTARDQELLGLWRGSRGEKAETAPDWEQRLVLAADQFVVARPTPRQPGGKSIIAGYHWFEDWGRDTMISLPGLTLATGRPDVAKPVLRAFALHVSRGMLPNRFADGADQPEYNSIDAVLWYFQAIRAYHEATGDDDLVQELFPILSEILDWHLKGTRHGIQIDPSDGLLRGGEDGTQLTWMDAKVGEQVITPRVGKPVEINALWYNALRTMEGFAQRLGEASAQFAEMSAAALAGFARFWNPDLGFCYDLIDGPQGPDAALRPNQIFAVSLPESPLTPEQQRGVVDACAASLLTSHGLRSLAPGHPAYRGHYGGGQYERDSAYHQGTVWAWLIGPFVQAHLRVYQDPVAAARFLAPFGDHLASAGLGTISEIFDGDAPFAAKGCIAQAWSVAEVLRALQLVAQT